MNNKFLKYGLIVIILGLIIYFYNKNDTIPDDKVTTLDKNEENSSLKDSYDVDENHYNKKSLKIAESSDENNNASKMEPQIGEYWSGEWKGINKWKRRIDVIRLEKQGGAFVFFEDHTEPRIYNYDSEKNVFVWKMDFYGKELKHIIKIFNRDTLLRNSWSGKKDFPELYQRVE